MSIDPRRKAAFTLIEVMVASVVGLILAVAIAALSLFSSRSFVSIANYAELSKRSQFALDKMSKEIREARQLTAFSTNSVTFADANGNPLSFTFSSGGRKLVRTSSGQTTTILPDYDSLSFWIYQHTMKSNSFDCYDVASATNARVICMTWKTSRNILGKKATTESVQTAKIVLRNR